MLSTSVAPVIFEIDHSKPSGKDEATSDKPPAIITAIAKRIAKTFLYGIFSFLSTASIPQSNSGLAS